MASAQLLQIADGIDSEVREVANNVIVVDDRVAGVDERVAGVDDRVKDVDDRVRAVDDKLVEVIDGAQCLQLILEICTTPNASICKSGWGSYSTSS